MLENNKKFGEQKKANRLTCDQFRELIKDILATDSPSAENVIRAMSHTAVCPACAEYFIKISDKK